MVVSNDREDQKDETLAREQHHEAGQSEQFRMKKTIDINLENAGEFRPLIGI
jgi:hypothetical protein